MKRIVYKRMDLKTVYFFIVCLEVYKRRNEKKEIYSFTIIPFTFYCLYIYWDKIGISLLFQ